MDENVVISLERYESMKEIMRRQSEDICDFNKQVADLEKSLLKVHELFSDPEVLKDPMQVRNVLIYKIGYLDFVNLVGRDLGEGKLGIEVAVGEPHYVMNRKLVE